MHVGDEATAEELYDEHYYASSFGQPYARSNPAWSEFFGRVADFIVRVYEPRTVLDAGCGIGFLVEALRERGVDARGFDVSGYAISQVPDSLKAFCTQASVADEIEATYDLIVCIEVLEHVTPALADRAIANFSRHTDRVLFSSTPEDTTEPTHVNVREPAAWVDAFANCGFFPTVSEVSRVVAPQAVVFERGEPSLVDALARYENERYQLARDLSDERERRLSAVSEGPGPSAASRNSLSVATDEQHAELLEALARRVWRVEAALQQERCEAREFERELRAVYASTSWRITAPLRALAPVRATVSRHARRLSKALYSIVTLQLRRELRRRRRVRLAERSEHADDGESVGAWFSRYESLSQRDLGALRELGSRLRTTPLVSVVMPVYDPPEGVLREAIESVREQIYENWELCIANDASSAPYVRPLLDSFTCQDKRIRLVHRAENGGISAASNDALRIARGEILVLLDHDDLLRPHSLLLAVREFEKSPEVGLVYSDMVVIDDAREPVGHYFKPDWNPALLLSQNFLCHLTAFRTKLVREVGGFRSEFDGSQDWDLGLRVTERLAPTSVVHIPHVLYLWRAIAGSVAADGVEAKPYAVDAGRRAVEDHIRRMGATGYIVPVATHQSVRFIPATPLPRIDVFVPSTGERALLEPCVEGVLERTAYDELRLTVVVPADAYDVRANREYLRAIEANSRAQVVMYAPRPFNFAQIVNESVAASDANLILLLNDDTEVVDGEWLAFMVGYARQDRVGAVGTLLLYPDGSIQSAGMLVGARGAAEHLYHHGSPTLFGYSNRARLPQDLTVVAGTCMLIRRDAFDDVGGWDESFPAAYNDVDFCLKLRARGWRVLYVPDAAVIHHESATFGQHQQGRLEAHRDDLARLQARWGASLEDDPMHNPNLALDASHPDRLAFPPRSSYPWRVAVAEAEAELPRPRQTAVAQLRAKRVAASSSSSEPENS